MGGFHTHHQVYFQGTKGFFGDLSSTVTYFKLIVTCKLGAAWPAFWGPEESVTEIDKKPSKSPLLFLYW